MSQAILDAARDAYRAGLSVVPPKEDGSKSPLGTWKQYQTERASRDQMRRWYGDRNGVGAVLGEVSGHVEMFEIEGDAFAAGELEKLTERLKAEGLAEAFAEIRAGYEQRTPRGGLHWLVRTEQAIPSTKLARDEHGEVKWEVKGEGGYAILAPSDGSVHPEGGSWELVSGGPDQITTVTRKVLDQIYAAIATLDAAPQPKRIRRPSSPATVKGDRPGDRYNADPAAQQFTRELLQRHGWTHTHTIGQTDYLRRPGKEGPGQWSATLGYYPDPPMFLVFSTSTEFETAEERGYTPFEVLTLLKHGGDHSAAAKTLAAAGYGDPPVIPGGFEVTIDGERVKPFPKGLLYTDTDNAERLRHLHADRLHYVMAWQTWLVWEGSIWRRDPKGVLAQELAKDVSRHLHLEIARDPSTANKDLMSWAKLSAGIGKIRGMVELARGLPGMIVDHEDLDADPWAFGVANGWIDLHDGTFHEPDSAKLMTMASPVAFDPDAAAPRWEKALTEWLPPEVHNYFQRLCGEAIVGTVRDHLLVLIHGTGSNGKSTAIDTLAKVFGPQFVVPHKSLLVLDPRGDRHDTERAQLFRARLAVAAETESSIRLAEASVKGLTGGDRLAARRLYENPWHFDPTHSLWLQTNHLPEIAGTDEGIWRRVRVMDWPEHFTGDREDLTLRERLATELPGILNWIIEGAIQWQAEGLAEPTAITEASTAYRQEQDQLSQFLEAMEYRLSDQLWCSSKQLQKDWAQWTEAELGRRLGGQVLAQRLQAIGLRKDTGRSPTWRGVGKESGSQ